MEGNAEKAIMDKNQSKGLRVLKKLIKIGIYFFLTLVGLNAILYILLSIPPIQQKLIDITSDQLKDLLKTEVQIREIRLSLFNHATIRGIYVEDQALDTLLYADYLDVRLNPWKILKKGEIAVTSVTLDDFLIKINQQDSISDFNFQFIVDQFSSEEDSTQVDSTESALNIHIKDIHLKRGQLKYDVYSDLETPNEFNASHIHLYDFHTNIDARSINPEALDIALNSFTVKDKSGLEISSLSGRLYSEGSRLWVDNLILSLPHSHLKTNKASFDIETNEFEIGTQDTEISASDLAPFMSNLNKLPQKIYLRISISGKLPLVNLERLGIYYGEECELEAKAFISSYEDYGNADIQLSIDKFRISPKAITDFANLGDSVFEAPAMLDTIGNIYFRGEIGGRLADIELNAEAWTRQGALSLTAKGGTDTTFNNMNWAAGLRTENFDVGEAIGDENPLGKLSMYINLFLDQTQEKGMYLTTNGEIESLQIRQDTMKAVRFTAAYNPEFMSAQIKTDTRNGAIFADAKMTQAQRADLDIKLKLDSFDIARIYKNEAWQNPRLSLRLDSKLHDLDINNMTGYVHLDSLYLHDDYFKFQPGLISLELNKLENQQKNISLKSSLAEAELYGEYNFNTLGGEVANILYKCLPSVFETLKTHGHDNDFKVKATIQNTQSYGKIFGLPMDIVEPVRIEAHVNTKQHSVLARAKMPLIKYNDMDIQNTALRLLNKDSLFHIGAESGVLTPTNHFNLDFKLNGISDSIQNVLTVKSDSIHKMNLDGKIESIIQFSKDENQELITSLNVVPSDIKLNNLFLNLIPASIVNKGGETIVRNVGFNLDNKDFFRLNANIANTPEDSLKLHFTQAHLEDLFKGSDIDYFKATLNGDIVLTDVMNKPQLYIYDFMVQDIILHEDTLGTLNIATEWSEKSKGIKFDALLQKNLRPQAIIDGLVPIKSDSLDFRLKLNEFDLGWLEPFTEGTLTRLQGSVSSDIHISGNPKKPNMHGFFGFNGTTLGIDYTNVVYTIADTIQINSNRIGFKNLSLTDEYGNKGLATANITHDNFKNFKMNMDMNVNKLMLLNTMHRTDSLFYGRLFASGKVNIKADKHKVDVNVQVKNEKNSKLNILIPQTSEASDYKSVIFINTPIDSTSLDTIPKEPILKPDLTPIILNLVLNLNQDLELGVVIDPITGDEMKLKGDGAINFTYDMSKDIMNTYGRFTLVDGRVKFNLQSIKKLDFKIRSGSSLSFIGDPFKTSFDIIAYRRLKADLKSLDNSFEAESQSTRVLVDCELGINGDLNKMDLSYDISLPDSNDDYKRKVSSLINTDEEKIKQFAYLIASGNFYSNTGGSGANFSDGMWTSLASSALSSGLNSALGSILGDRWEVGTNIQSNDGTLSSMDMSVSVSTKLFDDKLKLNTNIGYRTESAMDADNTFIGDFEAEYQLTPIWAVKAYNKTNERFYRQAPTTQGVGVSYTKDAPTLKKLFMSIRGKNWEKWQKRREEHKKREQQQQDSLKAVQDSLGLKMDSIMPINMNTPILQTDSLQMNTIQRIDFIEPPKRKKE